MANTPAKLTPRDYLAESDELDSISVEELIAMSEPVDAAFIDRRPAKKAISIRIDPRAVEATKKIAGSLGVGYQTMFHMWIMEGLARHQDAKPRASRAGSSRRPTRAKSTRTRTAA